MTIYFYCPDNNKPSGGVRQIYRQVDILNKHTHYDAVVAHSAPGFRCSWFDNQTRIVYLHTVEMNGEDILVAPELVGPAFTQTAPGVRKVIFNQNCYYTFNAYDPMSMDIVSPYFHEDLKAVITVSDDSERYLRFALPHLPVYRIRYSIDPLVFHHKEGKKKQISFMPRKNIHAATQVLNMLKFRGAMSGFEFVSIDGMSQAQVAEALQASLMFLSFGFPEGFGLPTAEAMACGCVVIGFHGGGGSEFFDPAFTRAFPYEDIVGFAAAVEEMITLYERKPDDVLDMGKKAAACISDAYSARREIESILNAWKQILGP